uniref:Sushi domain-containing protein n=1 Tax=Hucho hucho TaxID=62062 RepID=A0A4W5KZW8_9TELE
MIYYSCNVGFKPSTGGWWGEATCTEGTWSGILECIAQGVPCDPPPKVENAIVEIPYQNKYIYGFEVNYECRKFFEIDGLNKITCENGNWTTPPPTCKQPNDFCGPPPHLINGDTMGHTRERYRNGQSVQYVCQQYYILDPPSAYKTCRDGIWIGPMTCLSK